MCVLQANASKLLFFIDDTGHELLNDTQQRVFGLGGCSIMGGQLDSIIRKPWREVRRVVAGSPDEPLHAADIIKPSKEQIDAVVEFFRRQPIGRFGAICSVDTDLDRDRLAPLEAVARVLMNRIVEIAKWQPFESVALIFEHSERLESSIEHVFGRLELTVDDQPVPLDFCWMPKSSHEPGLEVADFLANSIGSEVRHRAAKRRGHAKNFEAFFHGIDGRLVSFVEIKAVASGAA